MKSSPLISVIVAVYNNTKYLPKCLDALLTQTFDDFEIICIDDASSDDSAKILDDFAARDSRIKVIHNSTNQGVSVSRNAGIDQARGKYIMFCDGDDYYEPTMCEQLYQAITQHQTDIAICEIAITYHAHQDMKISDDNYYALHFNGLQPVSENLIFYTDLAPTNKIFKKSLLDRYKIRFPANLHFEDAYFCVAYFCLCETAFYVNQRLYNYIRHAHSTMSDTWSNRSDHDFAIEHLYIAFELYDFLKQHGLLQRYNDLYWRYFNSFEFFALSNSKSRANVRQAKAAAREFLTQHQADFAKSATYIQDEIRTRSSALPYLNSAQIKRLLLKFMPTFRLEIGNIHRLQNLHFKYEHLLEEIDKLDLK